MDDKRVLVNVFDGNKVVARHVIPRFEISEVVIKELDDGFVVTCMMATNWRNIHSLETRVYSKDGTLLIKGD